jgi:hypothetical protein
MNHDGLPRAQVTSASQFLIDLTLAQPLFDYLKESTK